MPLLKPISGHTSCKGVYRYLTKDGRALAADYLNLDVPEREGVVFDWADEMDDTRSRWRNDTPWEVGLAAPISTTCSHRTPRIA